MPGPFVLTSASDAMLLSQDTPFQLVLSYVFSCEAGPAPDVAAAPGWRRELSLPVVGLRRPVPPRVMLSNFPADRVPAAVVALQSLGRSVSLIEKCRTFVAPLEAPVSRHPPPGYSLDVLRPAEAAVCNAHWKYAAGAATERILRACIEDRPSACVRTSSEPSELVGWLLMRTDGSIGVMHVMEAHRGRGLATCLVHAMLERIRAYPSILRARAGAVSDMDVKQDLLHRAEAAARMRPYCHIVIGNESSEAVFTKLGWTPVAYRTWVESYRPRPRVCMRLLAAANAGEMADLLAMINETYRADDAFFVDMVRTDAATLADMASNGAFYVGYAQEYVLRPDEEEVPLHALAHGLGDAPHDPVDGWRESCDLAACVHVSVHEEHEGDAPPTRVAHISMLAIAQFAKRTHVGDRVLTYALARARDDFKCTHAQAHIVSVKPWLRAFYERRGFNVVGRAEWPYIENVTLKVDDVHFHVMRRAL